MRVAAMLFAACLTATAQTLLESGRLEAARKAFDSASRASHLRCQVHPVRPALTYHLQLQAGYVVDVPLNQFDGPGHSLNLLLRITPLEHQPVYMQMAGPVSYTPLNNVDAEVRGSFVVGEGSYAAETLVKDDSGRACYSQWRFQAKLAGSEREPQSDYSCRSGSRSGFPRAGRGTSRERPAHFATHYPGRRSGPEPARRHAQSRDHPHAHGFGVLAAYRTPGQSCEARRLQPR